MLTGVFFPDLAALLSSPTYLLILRCAKAELWDGKLIKYPAYIIYIRPSLSLKCNQCAHIGQYIDIPFFYILVSVSV